MTRGGGGGPGRATGMISMVNTSQIWNNSPADGTGGGTGRSVQYQYRVLGHTKDRCRLHQHTRHAYSHDIFREPVKSCVGL
jgi:hypothetical protein